MTQIRDNDYNKDEYDEIECRYKTSGQGLDANAMQRFYYFAKKGRYRNHLTCQLSHGPPGDAPKHLVNNIGKVCETVYKVVTILEYKMMHIFHQVHHNVDVQ